MVEEAGATYLPALMLVFFGGKNKFDQENTYATFSRENVPEKPLHYEPSSIISKSSIMTMGIFPLLENS